MLEVLVGMRYLYNGFSPRCLGLHGVGGWVGMIMLLLGYYIQLLAIMNPFSALPTFLSLTEHLSLEERRSIVSKAFFTSVFLVLLFTFLGNYVLLAFSISITSLRIGGGILLMAIALDMLGGMPRTKRIEASDMAVVPLATPMIIGPGTITTILLLTSREISIINTLLVTVAGLAAAATTFLLLRYSGKILSIIPSSTIRAMGRFMSLIIASIAVEMILIGVKDYIATHYHI